MNSFLRESELRFNRRNHLRYFHVQISWGKPSVICVIKNIYNLQEFVVYKRHIFLLFLVQNVSLKGAWYGFVPGGWGIWGILGWGCTVGTLSLYQTNFQFLFITYHLSFYYSFIWLSVSFSVWFQFNYSFVNSFTYLITCDQVSFFSFCLGDEKKNAWLQVTYLIISLLSFWISTTCDIYFH